MGNRQWHSKCIHTFPAVIPNTILLKMIQFLLSSFRHPDLYNISENNETALEQALKEASNDETFRKVKRMSYSCNAADDVRLKNCYHSFWLTNTKKNITLFSSTVPQSYEQSSNKYQQSNIQ